MDGVSEVKDIVKRAHDWGHKAIAITDHGVVQAFPDANHFIESLDKEDPFKIIYGVEAYLVDDLTEIAQGQRTRRFRIPMSYLTWRLRDLVRFRTRLSRSERSR